MTTERMHPQDLRSIMAAILGANRHGGCADDVVRDTEKLIRKLEGYHPINDAIDHGSEASQLDHIIRAQRNEIVALKNQLKDHQRWETGIRNIVTILWGPSTEFQIVDVVHEVETLVIAAKAREMKKCPLLEVPLTAQESKHYSDPDRISGQST